MKRISAIILTSMMLVSLCACEKSTKDIKLASCYQDSDSQLRLGTSTDFIEVEVYLDEGVAPTGYEIYRKSGDESYKKIADVKSNEFYIKYTDDTVEPGKEYTYKMRAYKEIGKKTIYSEYSETYSDDTFYVSGCFLLETLTPAGENTTEIVVKLTNDEYSRPINIKYEFEGTGTYIYDEDPDGKTVVLKQFSYDNQNWTNKEGQTLKIDSGESIYLKFVSYDGKPFPFNLDTNPYSRIEAYSVNYGGLASYLNLDLQASTGTTYCNSEDIF